MFANDNLESIESVLTAGGLILYPTDTVWSIGCDATNPTAVERLARLKQKDQSRNFSILVDSMEMLKKYVAHVHPRIDTLLHYHSRPLTVVFDRPRNLASNLSSTNDTIGERIVKDEFCRRLIRRFGKPIVASSAKIYKAPHPNNFGEISSAVIKGVDYVVKYRQYEKHGNDPSVVVQISDEGDLTFLRI